MPAISVIIPTYNAAEYLPEAIESVLAQTFKDYELIVVDDGSTDGTESVVKKFGDRIRYFRQENRGPGAAKNLGIRNSRGPLLATLDADDKWVPHKLQAQYEYMKAHPEAGMVNANVSTFDEKGIVTYEVDGTLRKTYQGWVFDRLIIQNFIASGTVMFRKECLDKVGLFPENYMISEDWHLWLRIAKEYPVGYINEPLGLYRWQEKSLTWDYAKAYPDRLAVLNEIISLYPDYFKNRKRLIRRAYGSLFMRYGYALFDRGDYADARAKFFVSIRNNPFQFKSYLYLLGLLVPKSLKSQITRIKRRTGIRFMPGK